MIEAEGMNFGTGASRTARLMEHGILSDIADIDRSAYR